MLDYNDLKELARATGCRVADLLVLSQGNDPFYAGAPARRQRGEWFAEVWHRFGFRHGAHLRRIHYVLISQEEPLRWPDGTPYQNTLGNWSHLIGASLSARYLRLIPDGVLVDRRNPEPIIAARFDGDPEPTVLQGEAELSLSAPAELPTPFLWLDDFRRDQDYLVEIWAEKSTQNDVLVPLVRRLGCNLITGLGEMSETATRLAVARAIDAGKPMRILYVSDFDPAGRSMPVAVARKIEHRLQFLETEADVQLHPVVLTPEQCVAYRLPRTPIKETERRAERFEARFGAGATELDALEALHPGALADIITAEVGRFLDPTLNRRVEQMRSRIDDQISDIERELRRAYDQEIEELTANLNALREQAEELEAQAADVWERMAEDLASNAPFVGPDDIPRPRDPNPIESPLYDSRRIYLEQVDHFRAWQGRNLPEDGS